MEDEKAGQDNGKMEFFDQPLAAISQSKILMIVPYHSQRKFQGILIRF